MPLPVYASHTCVKAFGYDNSTCRYTFLCCLESHGGGAGSGFCSPALLSRQGLTPYRREASASDCSRSAPYRRVWNRVSNQFPALVQLAPTLRFNVACSRRPFWTAPWLLESACRSSSLTACILRDKPTTQGFPLLNRVQTAPRVHTSLRTTNPLTSSPEQPT